MGTGGVMPGVAEPGITRESSDLSRVLEERYVDGAIKANPSQAGLEHVPRLRAPLRLMIEKSGLKPLTVHTVDPLLRR